MSRVSFGIATAPQRVAYVDVLRVWREADVVPEIEHAWLFDHLMPIGGDRLGPIFEGWTLLSALAAQTSRLRLGPARHQQPLPLRRPILAKIATTVDVVSGGRLDFGIGAGSRTSVPEARREYDAHGLPYVHFADSVYALAEACTVIKQLWTESQPFDFDGRFVRLVGAFGNPKPVQQPRPPILIAGRTSRVLRVVAEHADVWNIAGVDVDDAHPQRPPRPLLRDRPPARLDHPLVPPAGSSTTTPPPPATPPVRPSTPASTTSSSACAPPTRTPSPAGSPTRSSPRRSAKRALAGPEVHRFGRP